MLPIRINGRFLSQRITGVQRYARELTSALIALGVAVEILVPEDADTHEYYEHSTTVGRYSGHLWEQLDLPRALKSRSDPLLINFGSLAPIAYWNQILTLHDVAYLKMPGSFSRRFRYFYRAVMPLMMARSRMLATVSEFSKGEILSAYGRLVPPTVVVPNAVDDRFIPGNEPCEGRPFIVSVSSLKQQKNFKRLIDAFARIPETIDCDLCVVGAPERAFAEQHDYSRDDPRIKFLGYVDDNALIKLYQNAIAFAFPSLYEGFGIPPLEAQACGCPVIASTAPGIRETLAESVLYFDPTSVPDIENALRRVIQSKETRMELADAGFRNVQRFSWRASAEKLLAASESLR